ncbi:MAG: CCA tRNA nucleotidyltransferase [bacterium]|nr:CCA tRNA nucleotidyltransferase [bacterium]
MNIELHQFVIDFLDVFKKNNFQIFVVGGSVRDLLMGKKVINWDFTTSAKPEEIMKLFPDSFYNNQFGTVGIPIKENEDEYVFEVTTFRKESDYTNKRQPDSVEWTDNVEEDLARRDFTINSMAYDAIKLVDLYNGQKDIAEKRLVAVGDPDIRFAEDALRLIRGVRLASQLDFILEEKTIESMKKNSNLITHISGERIRDEFFKILKSEHPEEGILLLKNTELLKHILPELDVCFSVQQKSPKRHHIYDVGTHLVMSLKHSPSKDVITRFATLLHDIGKAKTYRKDPETEIITFYNHEVVGTRQAEEIATRFRLSNREKDKFITLIKYHQFTVSELQTDKAVRRFIREVSKEYLQDMLDLRTADRIGSGATTTSWRLDLFKKRLLEVQKEPFKVTDLKIDGKDVMKIKEIPPGPLVGKILATIFEEVVEGKVKNERNPLLERLGELTVSSV